MVPRALSVIATSCLLAVAALAAFVAGSPGAQDLDGKVKAFLDSRRGGWRDMNVSANDGRILYDLVIKNNSKRALEIGTSTGHSGIWIAWALSKTGGKLVTVEVDEGRYREAVANFREAGLSNYIDARLADAHELVPALAGPFDFVFCDADKDWYQNYFVAVWPKLEPGGVFAAHNVSKGRYGWGAGEFLAYVEGLPGVVTTFAPGSTAGISITYKGKKN
jgi:caffeoyl-CoA O-methyltransferase